MKLSLTEDNKIICIYKDSAEVPGYWVYITIEPTAGFRYDESQKKHVRNSIVGTEFFLTDEQIAYHVRKLRKDLLNECDWTLMADADLPKEEKTAWKVYRQALRDITDQLPTAGINARDIKWPVLPQ